LDPFFIFLISLKLIKIDELKTEQDTLETRVVRAKAKARQLKHFQDKLEKAETEFKTAVKKLPEKKKFLLCCQAFPNPVGMPAWNFCYLNPEEKKSKNFMLKSLYP